MLMSTATRTYIVFRFMNRAGKTARADYCCPQARLPLIRSSLPYNDICRVEAELSWIGKATIAEVANQAARGELRLTSPMIPVFRDPQIAYSSTFREYGDPGLRPIISRTRFLASFQVPEELLVTPFTYPIESELMVLTRSLFDYRLDVIPNPFFSH